MEKSNPSEVLLLISAAALGALAATPVIWCFIFRALFTFTIFDTWQSIIYTWSVLLVQLVMMSCCLQKRLFQLNKWIEALAAGSMILTMFAFLDTSLNWYPHVFLPGIFVLNALLLSLWVPITYQCVYLCPYMIQRYYENGFLSATMLYYIIVFYRIYMTPVFLAPFCLFVVAGLYAFKYFCKHPYFETGLERRRAIFVEKSHKYVCHSFSCSIGLVKKELLAIACLLIIIVGMVICLSIYTDYMYGLGLYLFVYYFGTLSCCGLVTKSQVAVLLYTGVSAVITTLIFLIGDKYSHALGGGLISLLFLIFFHAVGCELSMIRHKLSKAINGPMLTLFCAMLCNFVISVTLLMINKVA